MMRWISTGAKKKLGRRSEDERTSGRRPMMGGPSRYDAIVVGAGPNGLTAAITMAQAGAAVLLIEANDTIGGGSRSMELTLPGFTHDLCSAIHPLALASPAFRRLGLTEHGLNFVDPDAPLAHLFDDGSIAMLERSVEATAAWLGPDARAYQRLLSPLVADAAKLNRELLGPLRPPRHPVALARFGVHAIRSVVGMATSVFDGDRARALMAGMAAHSMLPLTTSPTAGIALVLAIAGHSIGWPVARGGSQRIANALGEVLRSLGGEIITSSPVTSMDELPAHRIALFDVTPRQLLTIAGDRLPSGYRKRLARYRYGPGVFKMDFALAGPVPWKSPECARAGTVHIGGAMETIASTEAMVNAGVHPDNPFVLAAQQSLFDPSRAPEGEHTLWTYCHVPSGSTVDMSERMEAAVERHAPGFRDLVLMRRAMNSAEVEAHNSNYIGGDINGGVQDLRQLFTRPVARWVPYTTPNPDIYICSSSTPPGGGVHGMCGYWAARTALRLSSVGSGGSRWSRAHRAGSSSSLRRIEGKGSQPARRR
jgi:phytoene dehydrogenase-like protein